MLRCLRRTRIFMVLADIESVFPCLAFHQVPGFRPLADTLDADQFYCRDNQGRSRGGPVSRVDHEVVEVRVHAILAIMAPNVFNPLFVHREK
jgi:hypothetical protein